jgi:hypothetical protein
MFSLRYLNWFTKAEPLNAVVRVLLKRDFPLCLTYEIIDWGELTFCVSPSVGDDVPDQYSDESEDDPMRDADLGFE